MSVKIKFINNTVVCPTSWDEVTVRTFINPHFLSGNSISMLASITGIDREEFMNSTSDVFSDLQNMMKFLHEDPKGYQKETPKTFMLRDIECKVPQDIELEMLGQKIMLQDAMTKFKFVYEAIPDAIAIYLCPEVNGGKFDDDLVEVLREEVLDLRIVDCFPVADFFLDKCRTLMRSGTTS